MSTLNRKQSLPLGAHSFLLEYTLLRRSLVRRIAHKLRKHAYSNILTISPFSDKNSDILHISAQNIDCWYSLEPPRRGGCGNSLEPPRRGSSYEYPQSMIFSRNTCNPQFYYMKMVLKGFRIIYEDESISNQPIPFPMDRDGHDFHTLFQYMFCTWVQNCTRIE